jgi:hypothetical protein
MMDNPEQKRINFLIYRTLQINHFKEQSFVYINLFCERFPSLKQSVFVWEESSEFKVQSSEFKVQSLSTPASPLTP